MSLETREILERLQREPIVRTFAVDRASVNEDERTVELAIASDKPVDHWFGQLELSMDKKAVRTERIEQIGIPLLMGHDHTKQVGIIDAVRIDSDGVLRGTARFDEHQLAADAFRSVKKGILRGVSAGFMVHKMDLKSKGKNGPDVYRSEDWEPFEGSLTPIPADISVGVGRSSDIPRRQYYADGGPPFSPEQRAISNSTTETNMSTENQNPPAAPAVDAPVQRSAALIAADEIREWGKVLNEETAATNFIRSCQTAETPVLPTKEAFFATLRAAQPAAPPVPVMDPHTAAARQGGVQVARTIPRYGTLKAFRGKDADVAAYRSGKFLQAVLTRDASAMEYCRTNGIKIERMHSGNTNEAGGFLVPEEFENAMIDLRIEYGVFRRNANVVPMNTETKARPRRTGGLTAYPVGAGQTITESTKGWDRVNLTAKKWAVLAKWENELSDDSVINLADDLASEGAYALTNKEDECGFNGDGTSTYHGIVGVRSAIRAVDGTIGNIAGIQVATGNAYSEIVIGDLLGLIGKLPQYARRTGQNKFYCSNTVWANVLQRLALGVGGVTHAEVEGELKPKFFGYPVEITEVMPATAANDQLAILFGNLGQAALFGDRRGVTVAMSDSDSTDFAEDQMAIRITERFDIAVHDVGTTSVGGAVVALAMAGS